MRVERLAAEAGLEVRWRPFLLGPIFQTQGWNDSPFNIFAAKGRYMWRDLTRICEAEGLPLKLPPAKFPQNGLKAARIALAGENEGWMPAFTRPRSQPTTPGRRTSARTRRFARSSMRSASMRRWRLQWRTRLRTRTRFAVRPRRPHHAGCLAHRPSPSGRSCSGATTGWKPHFSGRNNHRWGRSGR